MFIDIWIGVTSAIKMRNLLTCQYSSIRADDYKPYVSQMTFNP